MAGDSADGGRDGEISPNDYSKTYHHSNPNCLEEPIVSSELQGYCKLLFKVIEKI